MPLVGLAVRGRFPPSRPRALLSHVRHNSLDNVRSFMLYVPFENRNVRIVSSNISDCNVSFPEADDEEAEWVRHCICTCACVAACHRSHTLWTPPRAPPLLVVPGGAPHPGAVREHHRERQLGEDHRVRHLRLSVTRARVIQAEQPCSAAVWWPP